MTRRLSDQLNTIARSLDERAHEGDPITATEMHRIALMLVDGIDEARRLEAAVVRQECSEAVARAIDPAGLCARDHAARQVPKQIATVVRVLSGHSRWGTTPPANEFHTLILLLEAAQASAVDLVADHMELRDMEAVARDIDPVAFEAMLSGYKPAAAAAPASEPDPAAGYDNVFAFRPRSRRIPIRVVPTPTDGGAA